MFYGLGSRASRNAPRRSSYGRSEFIPITVLAAAAALAARLVCVRGLTVVNDTRPKAIAVVRKAGDAWIWLPRRAIVIGDDGGITMSRKLAMEKGFGVVKGQP